MNPTMKIPEEKFAFVRGEQAIRDTEFETKPIGYFQDAMARLKRNRASIAAFYIICAIALLALFGPSMTPYGFNDQDAAMANMPPRIPLLEKLGIADGRRVLENKRASSLSDPVKYPEGSILATRNERSVNGVQVVDVVVNYYKYAGAADRYFWMGTDYLGRDLWARLWRGARVSLLIALIAVAVNTLIGIVYGAVSGFYGGSVDMVLMRITEIISAFPEIVVVTLFIIAFGTGITSIVLALLIRGWVPVARLVRAQFLRFKNREYVLAARTLGVRDRSLIFKHILPNSMGPIITRMMISVPSAIFTESFLAYIGLGLRAPEPSIGILLSNGQKVLLLYPYQTLFPAILISALMICFNLFSNGLRDALNPTMRGQE